MRGSMVQRPPPARSPTPGLLPVQGRPRPRDLRRQGQVAPQRGFSNYFVTLPAAAHRLDGRGRRDGRVDPGPQRRRGADAREHAHQAATSRGSTSAWSTTRATRSSPSRWTTSGPGPMVMRGRKRKGVRYFGPYGHAYAIRETLDLLLRTFPLRTCSDNKFEPAPPARPAVPAVPHREVLGPCVGEVDAGGVRRARGRAAPVPRGRHRLRSSGARDPRCTRRPATSSSSRPPACATGSPASARPSRSSRWWPSAPRTSTCSASPTTSSRPRCRCSSSARGRVVGPQGLHRRQGGGPHRAELVTQRRRASTTTRRRASPSRPRPARPDDPSLYEEWLTRAAGLEGRDPGAAAGRQARAAGDRHPQRQGGVRPPPAARATDHNSRAKALNELQEHLGLPDAPLRIECYDMSHIQGTDYVGSMVVGGGRAPEEVRVPPVQDQGRAGQRRLRRHGAGAHPAAHRLPGRAPPAGGRAEGKFYYPPQLLLVDGGKGQLGGRRRVLEELGLDDEIPVASLAKRFEEVYVPGLADPIRIPRQSEALYLLQRIRDEAHRFAIAYHRELRGKRMTTRRSSTGSPGSVRPQEAAGEGARRRQGGEASRPSRTCRRCRGCPTPVADRVHEKIHDPTQRDRERRPLGGDARWWQGGFTEGADPEYVEQILPIARSARRRGRPCSTSAPARGRSPRSPRERAPTSSASTPTAQVREATGGAGGPSTSRRGGGAAVRGEPFDAAWCRASCSSTSTTRRRHRRGRPVCSGRPVPVLAQPPAAPDARAAAGSTTRCSPRRSSTGGWALPGGGRVDRGGREGRVICLRPPPADPVRQRDRTRAWSLRRMEEPAPPPGFLARAEYQEAARSRACSSCSCRRRHDAAGTAARPSDTSSS